MALFSRLAGHKNKIINTKQIILSS